MRLRSQTLDRQVQFRDVLRGILQGSDWWLLRPLVAHTRHSNQNSRTGKWVPSDTNKTNVQARRLEKNLVPKNNHHLSLSKKYKTSFFPV